MQENIVTLKDIPEWPESIEIICRNGTDILNPDGSKCKEIFPGKEVFCQGINGYYAKSTIINNTLAESEHYRWILDIEKDGVYVVICQMLKDVSFEWLQTVEF